MELKDIRKQIDEIDKELLQLFLKRMSISDEVAAYKQKNQLPTFQPEREKQILERVKENSGELAEYSEAFFQNLMELSKSRQAKGKYGLLGETLGHSYSKKIHESLFCEMYDLVEVKPSELEKFLQTTKYIGLNVTIPYKKQVIEYCTHLSDDAKECGSVNLLVKKEDGWHGYNTDVDGFCYMVKRTGIEVRGKKALILGNGGATGAVLTGLRRLGAKECVIISRRGENNYSNLEKHTDAQVIVNATPVGMHPDMFEQIIDLSRFEQCEGVLDLIYNPHNTMLLLQGKALGMKYGNGLPMLVKQAAVAEEIFLEKTISEAEVEKLISSIGEEEKNLILVGMPGCGKTTYGKKIATLTGRRFIDLDCYIEEKLGISIPKIFETRGEAFFRAEETKALKEVIGMKNIVLATGGGTPVKEENRELLRLKGFVIFLERNIECLEKDGRPISLATDLRKLYENRIKYYKEVCDIIVWNVEHSNNI